MFATDSGEEGSDVLLGLLQMRRCAKGWTSFASALSVDTGVKNCLIQRTISSRRPQFLGQVLNEL